MNKSYVRLWVALLSILGLFTSQASFAQCDSVGLVDVMAGLDIGFSVDPSEQQPDFVLAAQGIPTRGFISPEARYATGEDVVTVQYESDHFLTYLWLGASGADSDTRIQNLLNFRNQHSDIDLLIDGVSIGAPVETIPHDGFNPWAPAPGSPMAYMFFYWISEPYTLTPGFHEVTLEYLIDGVPQSSTANLEVLEGLNCGFETGNLSDWVVGPGSSVGMPGSGAQEGDYAAKLINAGGTGVAQLFQFFPASEGEAFYLSGYMLSEAGLPDGVSFGLYKIIFLDEFGTTLQPESYCKGVTNPDFAGAEALPFLDNSSPADTWIFAEAQAVAPPGTTEVGIELTNVNFTGTEAPIWFDNVVFLSDPVPYLGTNCGYETGDLSGWVSRAFDPWGADFSVGELQVGAQEGNFAAKLTNTGGIGVAQLLQFFPASAGESFYLSGYMLSEAGLPDGVSWGLFKIFFRDEFNNILQPESSCKGLIDTEFPGVASSPFIDKTSPANTWIFSEVQAVAPPGTTQVVVELDNVNFTGVEAPIWFDNVVFASRPVPYPGSNCGFETGDLSGWLLRFGTLHSVEIPDFGAQEGNFAAKLTNPGGIGLSIIAQTHPASPGEEFYLSGYMATESSLPEDPNEFGQISILFWDEYDNLLEPRSVSKGARNPAFPGVNASPRVDNNSPVDIWVFSEAQGVAPLGTKKVQFELTNLNFNGMEWPIWFDDIRMLLVRRDMDFDGITDRIDTEQFTSSTDFSDGTSSGMISDPGNQVLWIVDEPGSDGLRILADASGGPGDAKIQMCGESGTLVIQADSEMVVTCGSIILEVEPGSEAVDMEFIFNGEVATVTVPAEYTVAYEPATATVDVIGTPDVPDPDPVILNIGGAEVPMAPGETTRLVVIDIKPGSDPNCFNSNGHGVIPVAILGSESLDVGSVDPVTLFFGGMDVRVRGNGNPSCGMDDTNADGYTDLVCHFEDDPYNWTPGNASATLSGALLDDTPISGTDLICIVP